MINWTIVSSALMLFMFTRYAYLAWHRQIYPNPVSWFIWAVVGVALFLTANASEAEEVYFASLIAAISPVTVFVIILLRETNRIISITQHEKFCLCLAIVGYGLWFYFRDEPGLAQWSLYWMIMVDLLALIPTLAQVLKKPESDKPLPWIIFGSSYFIAGLAITDHTMSNWALPIYMLIGSWTVATPMVLHRIKHAIPIRQWI